MSSTHQCSLSTLIWSSLPKFFLHLTLTLKRNPFIIGIARIINQRFVNFPPLASEISCVQPFVIKAAVTYKKLMFCIYFTRNDVIKRVHRCFRA